MTCLLTTFVGLSLCASNDAQSDTYVYICTGSGAYSYHCNRQCSGLNNCKAEIKSVTLSYAKSKKRKPCKRCYN